MNLKEHIRSVKDFPKPGIMFRDITTLLNNPEALKYTFNELYNQCKGLDINKVVGIESRGFMFGCMLAEKLNAGFVPVRKPGKLPYKTIKETYDLEYGCDTIEMHSDAIEKGDNVLLHDDLLATGGTARAAANLIEKCGGKVVLASFIIELSFLQGRDKLKEYNLYSMVDYDSED
jgi:adenine phosphoribosyltransferase